MSHTETDFPTPFDNAEVPFLVTHWLANLHGANFLANNGENRDERSRRDAIRRIRRAAVDIASAFTDLGAFGVSSRPVFSNSIGMHRSSQVQHATYSDLSRRWAGISSNHLQHLAHSSASTQVVLESTVQRSSRPDLIQAATEDRYDRQKNPETGRTMQDAIAVEDAERGQQGPFPTPTSILQRPPYLLTSRDDKLNADRSGGSSSNTAILTLNTDYTEIGKDAAQAMRSLLSLREQKMNVTEEIQSLQRSLSSQENDKSALAVKLARVKTEGGTILSERFATSTGTSSNRSPVDDIVEGQQNCERVIAQLKRRLSELQETHSTVSNALSDAELEAKQNFRKVVTLVGQYNDALSVNRSRLVPPLAALGRQNLYFDVLARQCGGGGFLRRTGAAHNKFGACASIGSTNSIRQSIIFNRLSHTATINSHMAYPVYCLRFDRTGRYFITGADDYLVKVFCMGVSKSCEVRRGDDGNRLLRINYGANATGAVLVATLRGHAGVINDIDVSADNCFLATASEDGDCRIWGLKDGCPIAILRGHTGGANMVSWSALTPYQLVTTGADGLARTWDIREAALKRYGNLVGKRPEYRSDKGGNVESANLNSQQSNRSSQFEVPLVPPLPARPNEISIQQPDPAIDHPNVASLVVPVPPLPPGDIIIAAQNGNIAPNGVNDSAPGQFVANDAIDEGVKLLSKLQHGPAESETNGAGTRARRRTVKVICVARSPLGQQFATGSDDGVCRIWEDQGDKNVEKVDSTSFLLNSRGGDTRGTPQLASATKILATLGGHVGAITDMQYSHSGNRLLTASQKDGVVRIWSSPSTSLLSQRQHSVNTYPDSRTARATDLLQIIINLTDPNSSARSSGANSRRRTAATSFASEKVSCDVAVWLQDDAAIVTSQSILLKQSTAEIVPGSQFLFLWDSTNGHCMLGISSAHTMQCPVVIPHPTNSNLVCSAGGDGLVKIWDWASGECKFQHKNTVDFGPIDPNDVGKVSGYLDGAFSPCGTKLVLTDDSGRVTICELQLPATAPTTEVVRPPRGQDASHEIPLSMMREQYFANDYYDLRYDVNGYCVESGSGQPPHLAPRGARSSHTGNPWPEDFNDAFLSIVGPSPLPVQECRWQRNQVRARWNSAHDVTTLTRSNTLPKKGIALGEYNPQTTKVIRVDGTGGDNGNRMLQTSERSRERNGRAPRLSSNFRWRDYSDLLREEGNEADEVDTDDEEFELQPRGTTANLNDNSDDSELERDEQGMQRLEAESTRSQRAYRRQLRSTFEAQQNAPSRMSTRRSAPVDSDSSGGEFEEFISTNNTPSGPHVDDYRFHFFRCLDGLPVARQRLRRLESLTSYKGHKNYTPQVGDTVVYIPRAHFEALKKFPTLPAPWQTWPKEPALPFVRCTILDIRFRFPYKDYFREYPCVVAILTLDITGIPESLDDKTFWWPRPLFKETNVGLRFEVGIFDIDSTEFIIPIGLYEWRLSSIEKAIVARNLDYDGLEVEAFYANQEQEDSDLIAYSGKVVGRSQIQDPVNDPHLLNSGFGSILVRWTDGTDVDVLSPWEVNAMLPDQPAASLCTSLEAWERKRVNDALDRVLRRSDVKKYFLNPVNERRYSDYLLRIEIPMDVSFIQRRLEANYYATRSSAVADFKLIHTNCVKYNGVGEISNTAKAAYEEFERLVLTEDERLALSWNNVQNSQSEQVSPAEQHGEPEQSSQVQPRNSVRNAIRSEDTNMSNSGRPVLRSRRSSRRGVLQGGRRSSLEDVPVAPAGLLSTEGGHRRLRTGSRTPAINQRHTRSMGSASGSVQVNRAIRPSRSNRIRIVLPPPSGTAAENEDYDGYQQGRSRSAPRSRSREAETERRSRRQGLSQPLITYDNPSDGEVHSSNVSDIDTNARLAPASSRRNVKSALHETDDEFSGVDEETEGSNSESDAPQIRTRRAKAALNRVQVDDSDSESHSQPMRTRRTLRRTNASQKGTPKEASDSETNSRPSSSRLALRSKANHNQTRMEGSVSATNARSIPTRRVLRTTTQPKLAHLNDSDSDTDGSQLQTKTSKNAAKIFVSGRSARSQSFVHSEAYRPFRNKTRPSTYYEKSSSGEDFSSVEAQPIPPRTRKSSRKKDDQSEDVASEEEYESPAVEELMHRRHSLRSKASARHEAENTARKSNLMISPRRSSRVKHLPSQENHDDSSEFDDEQSVSKSVRTSRKDRQVANPNESVASRRSTRDVSHSQLNDPMDDYHRSSGATHPSRKRVRPDTMESPNGERKQSKRTKTKLNPTSTPNVKKWPEINIRAITKVTRQVLKKFAALDEDNLFDEPVLEKYPDLQEFYLSHIQTPMDFRTILEDRLPLYESITELQDDLQLVFTNCMIFNAKDAELAGFARFMLDQMNSIFRDTCLEVGVSGVTSELKHL